MPRFALHSRLDLEPVFKQLGVTSLFDAQHAQLTKIDESAPISIKPFVHEAALVVDEQGSIATAATAGVIVLSLGPPTLRLDHPFLFVIRDNLTDTILFRGQLADPSADDR
jgi:serine protease inhibitor